MNQRQLIISLLFLAGCKDNPYRDSVQAEKADYAFSGIVELGTPISGATVVAHKFSSLHRGDKIGEAVSNRDGTFDLNLKTEYEGPVMLTATGGVYSDLATGEMTAFKPSQELRSAITHIKMPEKTNINAWTTMAVARVLADRGYWDKSVAELEDIDRINVDFSHVSYFLSGNSTNFINIRRQEFFDVEKDSLTLDDPKVTLHLAHGGLSQLAKDFSAKLTEEGIIISVLDLILALADDLSDRIFDGRNANGSVVFIGNNHRINLNSYTMRKNLSEAILLYSKRLQGLGKLTEGDKRSLEIPGKIVDSIARDTRPELFPASEQPKPLDKEPPTMMIHFAGEHRNDRPFTFLSGNVSFDVEAHDDSGIQLIRMIEPKITDESGDNNFGPITVDFLPQAMTAARACGEAEILKQELKKREISEENVICACFEAIDVFDNGSREISCFQRSIPESNISFPTSKTVLSSKSFVEGVAVKAKISSGIPFRECVWRIEAEQEMAEGILPSGNGVIDGTHCIIDEPIDGANLFNGNYRFVVKADDVGGRTLSEESDGTYVNFQVLREPPAVEVISPSNNDYMAKNSISVFGTVAKPQLVKEMIVSFRGTGTDNQEFNGSARIALRADSKEWAVSLGENLAAGNYAFDLVVRDIYGNEKKLPTRNITIDLQSPNILGALEGVPQNPYLQETVNFRQRLIDAESNPHYMIEPIGEASPIAWGKTPTIYRWLARIEDWATAPGYIIKADDENNIKEVRFGLDEKCAGLDEANKIAHSQDGRYDIRFTQDAANFDIMRGNSPKYCLSIWAIDQAGNASNHTIEFIWQVIASPIAIDMNASCYKAHRREDDISWVGPPVWKLFRGKNPIVLKKELVIGHVIMANPFSLPISVKLELEKDLNLKINQYPYQISKKIIDIKYFTYDLTKNEVGAEKTLNDGSAIIDGNENLIAKFILAKDLPIDDVRNPDDNFWRTFALELGFAKAGNSSHVVDGLTLITRDTGTGSISREIAVPWGSDHDVRRRSAPQVIAPRN